MQDDIEFQKLLSKIDRKIEEIDTELAIVDIIVQKDLDKLVEEYKKKLGNSAADVLDFAAFKKKHFQTLKKRKEESLERAKKRFNALKREIKEA